MKVKHYSVLSIDIPVADRDAGGIYYLKTQTGYKSYRVNEDTKDFIPLDATDVISDEVISTDKTWSSSKVVTYIKPTHRVRFDYHTGDSQIFDTGQIGIKVMSVLVNGVGLDISQYNDDTEENTADGTVEILDQLGNSDYIDIYYEK